MDQKYFGGIPFALSGDRDEVPLTAVDGLVSYTTGFGEDYSRELGVDPLAKSIRRLDWNGIMYDVTEAIGALQLFGYAEWVSAADNGGIPVQYGENATVIYRADPGDPFLVYRSLEAANTAIPTDDTKWQDVTLPVTLARLAMSDGASLTGYGSTTVSTALDRQIAHMKSAKDFGVIGDGIADDTAAMALVAAYSGQVSAVGMTILTDSQTVTGSLKLYGGTIKLRTSLERVTVNAQNVEFHGVKFDANSLNVNTAFLFFPAPYSGWVVDGCAFLNITGIAGSDNQYGILAHGDEAVGRISNCSFINISNVSDPAPVSGFCGGIFILNNVSGAKNVVIENIYLENIYTTNFAGDINNTDADGIRIAGAIPPINSNIAVSNVQATDVQKSAIKVTGTSGFSIGEVNVYNDRSDIAMVAAVRLLNCASFSVRDIVAQGNMSCVLSVGGQNGVASSISFRPIDTARDTCAGAMVQVMGSDEYPTRYVEISSVVGSNVGMAFDFETFGTTLSTLFSFVVFRDFNIAGKTTAGGVASRMRNAQQITLDTINLLDPFASRNVAIAFTNVQQCRLHRCRVEGKRNILSWTAGASGCSGIEFDGCQFFRPDSESANNFAFLNLQHDDASVMDDVRLKNCRISVPGYSSASAQKCITVNLTNSHLNGIDFYVRNVGSVLPPYFVSGVMVDSKVSDLKVSAPGAQALAAGLGWAVELLSGSLRNSVTDVLGSVSRGVVMRAGANNNLVDSISSKASVTSDAGSANIIGTTLTIP